MEVQFSKESFDDLDEIEAYLLYEWDEHIFDDFNKKLDHCIQIIMDGIVIFQKYEDTIYHKILITKHNTLIYRITEDKLIVHRILQNFQDPEQNYEDIVE